MTARATALASCAALLVACQGLLGAPASAPPGVRLRVRDAEGATLVDRTVDVDAAGLLRTSGSGPSASDEANFELEVSITGTPGTETIPFRGAAPRTRGLPLIAAGDPAFSTKVPLRVLVVLSRELEAVGDVEWNTYLPLIARQAFARTFDEASFVTPEACAVMKDLQQAIRTEARNATAGLNLGSMPAVSAEAALVIDVRDPERMFASTDAPVHVVARLFDYTFDNLSGVGGWKRALLYEEHIEVPLPCTPDELVGVFAAVTTSMRASPRVARFAELIGNYRGEIGEGNALKISTSVLNQRLGSLLAPGGRDDLVLSGLLGVIPGLYRDAAREALASIEAELLFPRSPEPPEPPAPVIEVEQAVESPLEESAGEPVELDADADVFNGEEPATSEATDDEEPGR